jgi:DNA-binding NarL/FixJ family response regulator
VSAVQGRRTTTPGVAGPLTILIVDRSPMRRAMLKRVRQLSGVPIATIVEAAGRRGALDAPARGPVNALFVEVDPVEPDGIDLLRAVHDRDEWRHVVCVATGAGPARSTATQSPALPLRGTLEMPFTAPRIRELLSNVLGM